MHLPSFLWLWKIAAWAMGLAIVAYVVQLLSSIKLWTHRRRREVPPNWLKPLHFGGGIVLVLLVLVLLAIGIVGTIGHYGSLGHSNHLWAGGFVVELVFLSAWSAAQIHPDRPWARLMHIGINATLCIALVWVSCSGWQVVQKYL